MIINESAQVVTGEQPFPGVKDSIIISRIITGERPGRPPGSNEWVSDGIWNFIFRCWSPSCERRPDVDFAINTLSDAADLIEAIRRKTNGQGRTSHSEPGGLLERRVDRSFQEVLLPSSRPPHVFETSSFVAKAPAGSETEQNQRKGAPDPLTSLLMLTTLSK